MTMSENNILRFPFEKTLENTPDSIDNKWNNVTTFSAFYKEIIKSKLEQNNNINLESLKQEFYDDISNIWRKISFWDFLAKFPSFEIFPNNIKMEIATKIIRNWGFHILRLLTEFYNFNYLSLNLDDFVVWLKHQFICNWKSLEWFDEYIQSLKNRSFSISHIFDEWCDLDMNNVFQSYRKHLISKKIEEMSSSNVKKFSSVKLSWIVTSMQEVENSINKIDFVLKNSLDSWTYVIKIQNIYGHFYEIMYTPHNSNLTQNNFFDISILDIDDYMKKIQDKFNDFRMQLHSGVYFWFVLFKK